MIDQPFLCEHCVADNELRLELQQRGETVGLCPTCHQTGGRALAADDSVVRRTFRALIRLHFSEWDYNDHIGGTSLEMLVFRSKEIFNLNEGSSLADFEQTFLTLTDENWYPDTDEGIALGGGYWDGGVLEGLRIQRDSTVEGVVADALNKNWFDIEPRARALIQALQKDLSLTVPAGTEFVRARVGVHSRVKRASSTPQERQEFRYLPYTGKDIDRPPLAIASEGRFNRNRVSILYLASDAATAVAELRPHPGHLVSTARFRLKRDLRAANFAKHDIRRFLSDRRLEELRQILSIADVLNVPVQPEHRMLYGVTQLFADVLRGEGFEALTFRSSVGKGSNLTCFTGEVFEMVSGSEEVVEVAALQYRLLDMPVVPQDYDRQAFVKDEDSPLSVLLHGMARQGTVR